MPKVVSITNLRRYLFMIADWIMLTDQEIFVERDGKLVMKLVSVKRKQENKEEIRKIELKMKNIWENYPKRS